MKTYRAIAIACGGTGGHLFPGLAVAEELKSRGWKILLILSEKSIDERAMQEHPEFESVKLPSIGLPPIYSPRMLQFTGNFSKSLIRCLQLYRRLRPDAVLGMGGFTSTAPILAGRMCGAATFIHESNSILGKANRLNTQLSKVVLLGFSQCAKYVRTHELEVTGTPVRLSLRQKIARSDAFLALGLSEDRPVLLVMGGSQGARGINEMVSESLGAWKERHFQVVHLTGEQDEERLRRLYEEKEIPAFVSAFYDRMELPLNIADLVIARSGASTLAELSWFGLPSILVPYPHAAEDHQTVNAEIFARAGAARVIQEGTQAAETLRSEVATLMADEQQRRQMGEKAREFGAESAAAHVADAIEQHL